MLELLLTHMLDVIVSKGDAHSADNDRLPDHDLAAQEIAQLLAPLAKVVSMNPPGTHTFQDGETLLILQRDAWFNIVVHGFGLNTPLGKRHLEDLRTLAQYTRPLIAEERANKVESDVELNTVLRRGKSGEQTVEQKRRLIELLPSLESDIKSLSHSEVVFLNTAMLVEQLRASTGDCSQAISYFLDTKLRTGPMGNCMVAIATAGIRVYLAKTMKGDIQSFSTPYVAQQLAAFLSGCCHRIVKVQQVSTTCANLIINTVPSSLCQKTSLFALLELLTIMWDSCLEGETDEYDWRATFKSTKANVAIELSDDYAFRHYTLKHFHERCKEWVLKVLEIAPLDIKGLLQTYLSEYDDEGAYGHVALGRSFALEMGAVIPSTDQRLGAIERQTGLDINTASDFVAQYTTRQEYRYLDDMQDHDEEWVQDGHSAVALKRSIDDAAVILKELESRTYNGKQVSIAELRDGLRRAAALLCRVKRDECTLAHHLVGIPFAVFSKQSIKLGISLWMSVIKENPRMETRVLVEIAENWENSIHKRKGLFNAAYQ